MPCGPAFDLDALDLLHRLGVEHSDLRAAAEPVMRGRVDGHSMTADIRNGG